ncbi:hypothetical protein IKD57_00545 [Candidatus Saccharibacteria bacterium]|nr:hypothetical protein [Candidatus Saccharibacteria bacterium]
MANNESNKAEQVMLPLGEASPARPPATNLMKTIAKKAPRKKDMAKVFTTEEIAEIIDARLAEEKSNAREHAALKEKYRRIKRQAKEMEAGNKSRVIVFPSLTNGEGWYKTVEFSALYYAYRLADRMGRRAKIYRDSDKFSKCSYTASLQNMEKFVEQFKRLEDPKVDITEDGVYIFTLKHELTDEEISALYLTEETRREKLHNIVRPKNMDPATYQAILMVMRQVAPRARKLEKQYYTSTGNAMVQDIQLLMSTYLDFTNGLYDRAEAGKELMHIVNRLFAGLAMLAENRVWAYDVCTIIGENINQIKRIVEKNFNMKVIK